VTDRYVVRRFGGEVLILDTANAWRPVERYVYRPKGDADGDAQRICDRLNSDERHWERTG
jgi:hypothetical protein